MSDLDQTDKQKQSPMEPVLPTFGLAISSEEPCLQLCKPKLLPLKTYSYIRMQIQEKNRLNQASLKAPRENN